MTSTTVTSASVRIGSIRFEEGARRFYRRWVLANAWSEGMGLGTTSLLMWIAAPRVVEVTSTTGIILSAAGAIVVGMLLEGVLVGMAQEQVLRLRMPAIRRLSWVIRTTLGAGLAWLLGMVPGVAASLATTDGAVPASSEPTRVVQFGLAVMMGVALGALLGAVQWTALRRHASSAGRWILANAAAWAVGMPLLFAGMDLVPWTAGPALITASIYAIGTITGLIVGSIHGVALMSLITWTTRVPGDESERTLLTMCGVRR
jgi:hypothetical protein